MGKNTDKSKVFCSRCGGATNHSELKSVDTNWAEFIDHGSGHGEEVFGEDSYQIIQCQGCERISFRHLSWFSEIDEVTTYLYPKRSQHTRPIKKYLNVPSALRRIYRETIDCFNDESFTLCAAGLRAIVEGICADQGIEKGPVEMDRKGGTKEIEIKENIKGKIEGLREEGILTERHADTLHEHRYLGNKAIHELSRPSRDELVLAIEILEHTLDVVYEVPDKAEKLRRARDRKRQEQEKGTKPKK